MNKEQVKGAVKESAGKAQSKAGELTGSTEHQAKGKTREAAGHVEKKVGDVKESVKDSSRKP